MNQILSVEMPKKKSKLRNKGGQGNKASTKSVVIFFSVVLIIFGIGLIGVSIYSMLGKNKQVVSKTQANLPRIDVTQNATELEIEISCDSQISSIEYNWEGKETKQVNADGKSSMDLTLDIPSGANIFTMKVTDINGKTNEYSKQYVGGKEPNITTFAPKTGENKIIITCEETQIIKSISY